MNPLVQLREAGQSPWYDYIRRGLLTSGELQSMIDHDGLMGMTSNPSIFEKAIAGSSDYDDALRDEAARVTSVKQIYEALAIRDIQGAADLLKPVYEKSAGRDGYVSLEVSPDLAFRTRDTIDEAVRLHEAIGRRNVMIKVPGTPEGLPAIEYLLGQGINVNVTLLFSVDVYEQVAWSYIRGLEKRAAQNGDLRSVASVASFFVSRIDTLCDHHLEAKAKNEPHEEKRKRYADLMGKVAIANAKLAYRKFERIFASPQFLDLKRHGARVQRLLWASTGTKNPRYPDTYYVDNLIGPETVNTMPAATFSAFRDHGTVRRRLLEGVDDARAVMDQLEDCGISLQEVTDALLKDGTRLFVESFDQLMGVISRKREDLLGNKLDRQIFALGSFHEPVKRQLQDFQNGNFGRRLWAKDPTLWHGDPAHHEIICHALGWLTVIEQQIHHVARLRELAEDIKRAGFRHVLLLGMGGSSLCPEVFRMTFGVVSGYPELHVLDSTVPGQIRSCERQLDLAGTLCVVASKSGSTTEPLMFQKYLWKRLQEVKGEQAAENMIAITDPGSLLETIAKDLRFRAILPGVPEIGGRYSALSNFGMVPAALMGVNVEKVLSRAERMRHSCDSCVPAHDNPGVRLGTALGLLARAGRDKVTFVTSPAMSDLGAWLEQLLAESTGKEGKGIIPIDDEPLAGPEQYGNDRVFAYIRYAQGADPRQDAKVEALKAAGYPVVSIDLADLVNIGEEFFLWEIATAVAGSILGINAFDQPNVQESKDYTRGYMEEFKRSGRLPEESPLFTDQGMSIFTDHANREALGASRNLDQTVAAHLARIQAGDYVAINAYVERTPSVHALFQNMRVAIRDAKKVATTLGYGPRFLHSTGQLHKGGPNTGVFFHITADDREDLAIPDEPFTFGILKAAQALGDFQSLSKRQRRIIRIHLGLDVEAGLRRLQLAIEKALNLKKSEALTRVEPRT